MTQLIGRNRSLKCFKLLVDFGVVDFTDSGVATCRTVKKQSVATVPCEQCMGMHRVLAFAKQVETHAETCSSINRPTCVKLHG